MHRFSQTSRIEELLIRRIKNREVAALDILFDWYSPAFFGVIYGILRNREIAEEVLQDVFLKIWQQIDQYDESKARFFTWAYRIARNKAIDARRSHDFSASQKSKDIYDFVFLKTEEDTKSDYVGVFSLIGHLNDVCQKLILMNFFEGYSHGEISKNENIPLGTVKTRLRNCLNELRKQLQNENLN